MSKTILTIKGTAILLRFMSGILRLWTLAALIAFFYFPAGPHLLLDTNYRQYYEAPRCLYIGSRGFVAKDNTHCSFMALLNSKHEGIIWPN